jgi:hypothetical protein
MITSSLYILVEIHSRAFSPAYFQVQTTTGASSSGHYWAFSRRSWQFIPQRGTPSFFSGICKISLHILYKGDIYYMPLPNNTTVQRR